MSDTSGKCLETYAKDPQQDGAVELRIDPFQSLRVHFGMLMGVEDFELVQAYSRGKTWLHAAWLHGPGVVWGLAVSRDGAELRVERGLALDGAGRELHLDQPACLDVGRWFEKHGAEHDLALEGGALTFDAYVTIEAKECLGRAVPALVEPCEGSGTGTAWSRVRESVALRLVPGEPPPAALPYRRLRVYFGLAEPVDAAEQEARDARAALLALPAAERGAACLEAFRRLAGEDAMELSPATDAESETLLLTPEGPPAPLVLAALRGIRVRAVEGGYAAEVAEVDPTPRRTHVATSTVQELLCGALGTAAEAASATSGGGAGGAAGSGGGTSAGVGSRAQVQRDSLRLEGSSIFLRVSRDVLKSTVAPAAFEVSEFTLNDGWRRLEIAAAEYAVSENEIRLDLAEAPAGEYVRVIARGTGPFPLLDYERAPLAGAAGETIAAGVHDGADFVHMQKRS